ncbi:MAG TPA: YceD family protein [Verrucomicrobiae bacterium]
MLSVNLRHLEAHGIHLQGELPLTELDLDVRDELIQVPQPVSYDLAVELLDGGLLVQGRLQILLECECVRCLKKFKRELKLNPWTLHLPLAGEDAVSVDNDCVDLTSFVREDILLEFPQHPLCKPECRGLEQTSTGNAKIGGEKKAVSPTWTKLDKLKL